MTNQQQLVNLGWRLLQNRRQANEQWRALARGYGTLIVALGDNHAQAWSALFLPAMRLTASASVLLSAICPGQAGSGGGRPSETIAEGKTVASALVPAAVPAPPGWAGARNADGRW